MAVRRSSIELRVVSDTGTVQRAIPLPRTARALLVAVLATALVALVGAAAVAPSVLTTVRARHEYELQLVRRTQLGDRLRALVESLSRLERQSEELAGRLSRYETIYGLGAGEPPAVGGTGAADHEPATIFVATVARGRRLAAELAARLSWLDLRIAALASWEAAHPGETAQLPIRWPLEGETSVPTSGFGARRIPGGTTLEFHSGLDVAAPAGTRVLATGDGQVIWAADAPPDAGPAWWRLGRLVAVRHGDRFLTLYGHCERALVERGRRVRAGEAIAIVGATGWTASPQLHYEIRQRGADGDWTALDPRVFLLAMEPGEGRSEPATGGPGPAPLPRALRP